MAERIDPSLITATGRTVDVTFSYEDPILEPYEQRAEKRLAFILEQLDLGSDANLGYTKVTWMPDRFVRVRYLAMEGVLQPIIVVRVEFAPGVDKQAADFIFSQEILGEEEEEEIPPLPPEATYFPYAWIGIHAGNHKLSGGIEGNGNKDFWGYPVDPRLVGFEPTVGGESTIRFFNTSVESLGGSLVIGPPWQERVGSKASEQFFFRLHSGQSWQMNQFGIDQGTFQDGDWFLSSEGVAASSQSRMIALEHLDTFVTAPQAAFGTGLEELPANYWKRSIIIPGPLGVNFPEGPQSGTIDVGGGVTAAVAANYGGGVIASGILHGTYEISCFAQSFHCEATVADLHIRVVMGNVSNDGSPSQQTVFDFFPLGIGSPCSQTRKQWVRVTALGGNPPCGFDTGPENVFGPNDGGAGWWDGAIYLDVEAGTASSGAATRNSPYFGSGCNAAEQVGCEAQECVGGCTGGQIVQPAHSLDAPFGPTVSFNRPDGSQGVVDLRGGVLWHMARVIQVDAGTGHICFIQLLGNDGAQGGGCSPCQAFSYGTMVRAKGYLGLTELGQDLSTRPEDKFGIGELVTVIGWTDVHSSACLAAPGDWRLLVTTPHGAGQDFTSLFWSGLRCPDPNDDGAPVNKFFKGVEFAYLNRAACQGPPVGVKCNCTTGQMSCRE